MEGPYLPEGSGGEQPPEWLQRQLVAYAAGLEAAYGTPVRGRRGKRRALSDYTTKNCEEAWGDRSS